MEKDFSIEKWKSVIVFNDITATQMKNKNLTVK